MNIADAEREANTINNVDSKSTEQVTLELMSGTTGASIGQFTLTGAYTPIIALAANTVNLTATQARLYQAILTTQASYRRPAINEGEIRALHPRFGAIRLATAMALVKKGLLCLRDMRASFLASKTYHYGRNVSYDQAIDRCLSFDLTPALRGQYIHLSDSPIVSVPPAQSFTEKRGGTRYFGAMTQY
jgi:hypothetical protein